MATVTLRRAGPFARARVLSYLSRLDEAEGTPAEWRIDAETLCRGWFGQYRAEAAFAETDGVAAGFGICLPGLPAPDFPDALYAAAAFVEPQARGRGVGRALIGWFAARARMHGRRRLIWCCRAENAAACAFSERLGAVPVGERTIASQALRFFARDLRVA